MIKIIRTQMMKKKYTILCFSIMPFFGFAQVGINTTTPEATLDIRAKNHLGTVSSTDGILVPRVNSLSSSGSINGQLVYLIADAAPFTKGFYYWNGSVWTAFSASASGDVTNDAWVNNSANTRVELGTQSDGSTVRNAGAEFVIKDNGLVGIGTASPKPSSILEIKSSNKGILIPQVALTGKSDIATVPSPATGLIVYNTADAGTGINTVRANTMYRFANGAWDNLVTPSDFINENEGVDTKKIQVVGTPNPATTIISGYLEFRLSNSAATLQYDCRLAANPGTETITLNRSTGTGIGTTPTNTNATYSFTSANWSTWVTLEDIVIANGGHLTYLSLTSTEGPSKYAFYVLNVQRIGNSNTTTGLKSLIINRY